MALRSHNTKQISSTPRRLYGARSRHKQQPTNSPR
nr:MAG TPA: hypothetical protein [Caudoviricetes sp.]